MNTRMVIAIAFSVMAIAWALWITAAKPGADGSTATAPTASIVDGTQIVDIAAKGGYSPRVILAKAGIPTVLRITTKGTFDCSASVVIPKLSYQKFLEPAAVEEVAIPAEQAQGTLQGLCTMGMYNFQIRFQ